MKEIRVRTNQIELQVRDYQHEGEAIVFLHFGGTNLMVWQRVVPYFQDRYRLILVDLRGHGKSDITEGGYHMDEMARDVIGVLDHLQIDKAHIIGSSLGAEVGLSLAANHQERVLSLILDGAMNSEFGPYGLWEGTEEAFNQHVNTRLEKIRNTPMAQFSDLGALMQNRKEFYEKYDWWNEYVAEMEQYGAQQLEDGQYSKGWGKQSNLAYMQEYFYYRFENYYPKVQCPLLMLTNKDLEEGREKEVLLGLRDLAKNAELGQVSGWEHPYLWMLDPDKACKVILKFLDTQEFRKYLLIRNADERTIQLSISLVDDFNSFLEIKGYEFQQIDNSILTEFTENYIVGRNDAYDLMVALVRYYRFKGKSAGLSYLLTLIGTNGVLDSIEERMKDIIGEEAADPLVQTFVKPPLGSRYELFPPAVHSMLETMQKELPLKTCQKILAGNHHRMPAERFEKNKLKYLELGIDGYLKWRHDSMIESMEECLKNNTLWYEQVITPVVLNFVKGNQEIQSGIRKGNIVYVTKIPFDTEAYLAATDDKQKRFHACHCPFVRSSIADGSLQVAPLWCYCTGGFEKMPFDVIFGKELPVEVLQTVLGGDPCCRFAITIPDEAIPESEKDNFKS